MNLPNLHLLISAIESEAIPGLGFNMGTPYDLVVPAGYPDRSGRGCRTVACIGGWCWFLQEGLEATEEIYLSVLDMIQAAEDFLEISREAAKALTMAPEIDSLRSITWEEAKATLLRLAATGEVAWVEPAGSGEV